VAQSYIERYGEDLAGCVLSGTRGPGGLKITLGGFLTAFIAALAGRRRPSRLVRALVDGRYRAPFKPNRTAFDWLSRDNAVVDGYEADPLCGQLCSAGFYRDMAQALRNIHAPESMKKIRRDLPIYVFCGSADPVGDMGASPTALVNAYRTLGITDLEFVLYPDARHETLNETNREEVIEDLVTWLNKHHGVLANGVLS
jgi:alpha-beta hydrolase superfamily lysophospholipase